MTLAGDVDIALEVQKLEKVELQLMIASREDREAMQAILRAYPYIKAAQDTGEVLR